MVLFPPFFCSFRRSTAEIAARAEPKFVPATWQNGDNKQLVLSEKQKRIGSFLQQRGKELILSSIRLLCSFNSQSLRCEN